MRSALIAAVASVSLAAAGLYFLGGKDTPTEGAPVFTRETCTVEGYSYRLGTYLAREVPCLALPDGGLVLPRWPERNKLPDFVIHDTTLVLRDPQGCDGGLCDDDEDDAGTPRTRPAPFRCACRTTQPDAGLCRWVRPDGGQALVPFGETVGPGYVRDNWVGLGCVRKPCQELSGQNSMPAECQ